MKKISILLIGIFFLFGFTSCNGETNNHPRPGTILKDTGSNLLITVSNGEDGQLTGAIIGVINKNIDNWKCTIPSEYQGIKVSKIEYTAFANCSGLTSIIIPSSITSIGNYAFDGCSSLTEIHAESFTKDEWRSCLSNDVRIPNDATIYLKDGSKDGKIVDGGIIYYVNLDTWERYVVGADKNITTAEIKSIIEGDPVTSIGMWAFDECSSLTSITVPDFVTSIGIRAFSNCSSLASVTIGNSVTSIGDSAFNRCTSLTNINIPNAVTSIGDSAFSGCSSLASVTIGNSVTSIGEWAFADCSNLASVTIGNSVTSIGSSAFDGCTSLTSINIPSSVISIEERSFYGCSSLASVTIGNSVTSIGEWAFSMCSSLTEIHAESFTKDEWRSLSNNASIPNIATIYLKDGLKVGKIAEGGIIYYVNLDTGEGHVVGPDKNITTAEIKSVIEGAPVTSIVDRAFSDCSSLISITIPDSVTSIGNNAFMLCWNLTSINIKQNKQTTKLNGAPWGAPEGESIVVWQD